MTGEPRLRVGLIGAGMVSGHHLAAWAEIPQAVVVAIADPDQSRARQRADTFRIDRVFDNAESLIDTVRPDAIDIAAPVSHHGDLCRLAADKGVAILCQKPLAGTCAEAARIVEDVGSRVRFMVHENWRFRPPYRQMRSWMEDRRFGDIGLVRLSVRSSGFVAGADSAMPGLLRQPFLADLPRFLVFELLIHHLDVLRWLLGPLTVASARLTRVSPTICGEDTAAIILTGDRDLPVVVDACYATHGANIHVEDHMEIVGTKTTARLSDTELTLVGTQSASIRWDFDAMYAAAYEGALREFVAGLQHNRAFETEARDNLEVLALVEDIYAAAGWVG